MSQTRPATSIARTTALILAGGAVAAGIGVVLTIAGIHDSPFLAEFRGSTAYYAMQCFIAGAITAAGPVLTRPRGPATLIVAAVAAFVALDVGTRIGVLFYGGVLHDVSVSSDYIAALLKPRFHGWDLLAPLVAGAITGLRLAVVSGDTRFDPAPFPQPGPGHEPPSGEPPAPPFGPGQGPTPGTPPGWTPPHDGA
ncbi:hypothetical protein [Actinomadura sp. B10D3]|uniref:hypothetical protein n=1 Tax=Actinomadura sp. B10D3 TaxID=3153557 RepID=UPI00325F185B